MSLKDKWDKDKQPLQPLKNENLTCNTCRKCQLQVLSCEAYERKPISVLKGGVCGEYKKKK